MSSDGGAATGAANWAVSPGFALSVDTSGYDMPTALAFVPRGGPGPKDPLYFVTELRGQVKVVTNDRTVSVFATVPAFKAAQPIPAGSQAGLAGICLDPDRGYVFVTYTYEDDGGVLRNNISRFETDPGTFDLRPTAERSFTSIFDDVQSAPAHQIGNCQVSNGKLFVGVGDGGNPSAAGDVDQLLGKVLCLTTDGRPCPSNPFARSGGPRRFVWAYGFRNPFGVEVVGDKVFVAENGIDIDRFLTARKGQDHHWNGSDASIGVGADVVFSPPFSPVQLAYHADGILSRDWKSTFLMAAAGDLGSRDAKEKLFVGVVALSYDAELTEPTGPPRPLAQHRGETVQSVAAMDLGPDGVYFAELLPTAGEVSRVLRIRYDPENEHDFVIGARGGPRGLVLMEKYGCSSCHSLGDGGDGGIAPSLDPFGLSWRLRPRLNSAEYDDQVARVDRLEREPFLSYREERRSVLDSAGDERVIEWIKYKILEPRFDDPEAQMPDVGASEDDAEAIAEYLAGTFQGSAGVSDSFLDRVKRRRKAVAFGVAVGVSLSLVTAGTFFVLRRASRRRARAG